MKLNNNDDSHNSGLNLLIYNMLLDIVTPYVGVWIETLITCFTSASIKSHPAWEYMDWSIVHSSVKFMEEL